jgi:hypothetical protein
MHIRPTLLLLSIFNAAACSSRGGAPGDPGAPAPVAEPGPEVAVTPRAQPASRRVEGDARRLPVRADQAPLVEVRDALQARGLLGQRVRVAGRCAGVGAGRTAGSWILRDEGASIEVRGRVPSSCSAADGAGLTIFAQIEPKAAGSRERLLLRLPD